MADFTEVVRWSDAEDLRSNLLYGLQVPRLNNIIVEQEGLTVGPSSRIGQANYKYDFGRDGEVTALRFAGSPLVKFRIKTADTAAALAQAEFFGTEVDVFSGLSIDTAKYTPVPNAYQVTQSGGGVHFTGVQSGTGGVFTDPAALVLNAPLTDTYGVRASIRLTTDPQSITNSGGTAFLELDSGVHNIQVQKYLAQIRSKTVDTAGNDLGRDVDSNNIILGEEAVVTVNSIPSGTDAKLTDGRLGVIRDKINSPVAIDTFENLKIVEDVVDFLERTSLTDSCVRILGARADYSLTGILADSEAGLIYRPKRIHDYFALRVPLVNPKIDLFANEIVSLNLTDDGYVFAEVSDRWTTTILVSPGNHRYYFEVDGQKEIDVLNPNVVETVSGVESTLTIESTQFVEFVFNGKAQSVNLILAPGGRGSEIHPMEVEADPSEILKISREGETYYNAHPDWHKIEIEFEEPVPVSGIRFLTDVPFEQRQRIRILLDDSPITKDEWSITCSAESVEEPGISECATYSNLLESTFEGDCLSFFDNNADTITASEDGFVEWNFIADDPIVDRDVKLVRKFAFMSRLENGSTFQRAHRSIELLVPSTYVSRVTDFLVSDDQAPFRAERQTTASPAGVWTIPQLVLREGSNTLTPSQVLDESATYGDPTSITATNVLSFIEPLNQSGVAINNTEIGCTLATNLTQDLERVQRVVDTGVISSAPSLPDPRFTRESFTRASDRLRVVVINISIEPAGIYFLNMIGQPTNFRLELYETLNDAQNRSHRVGFAESTGYGFQSLSTFTAERQIEIPTGLIDIEVTNILACFDENAANTILETRPRANV